MCILKWFYRFNNEEVIKLKTIINKFDMDPVTWEKVY